MSRMKPQYSGNPVSHSLSTDLPTCYEIKRQKIFLLLGKKPGRFLSSENIAIFDKSLTQNEPIFSVSTSPNRMKLHRNNETGTK